MTDKPFTPRPAFDAARTPIEPDVFAAMMAGLGPFESAVHLAVGVSGGADSMALVLLCDEWARARGGRVSALIVEHGLRADSALEAAGVKRRLGERGIEAHILPWQGTKPLSGIQAAARTARFGLLTGWARKAGVLHLLLGHHRDDQAETFLMRLDAKSGVDGLSAMSAIVERDGVRVLRPFLSVPKGQLIATVTQRKTRWIEDPSNKNRSYTRVRVRDALESTNNAIGETGLGVGQIAGFARQMAPLRMEQEKKTWGLLGRAAALSPQGFAVLDADVLKEADRAVRFRALHGVLRCIGGREHGPKLEKTERLLDHMLGDRPVSGRTLGGCGVFSSDKKEKEKGSLGHFIICRERRSQPKAQAVFPDGSVYWDGRFSIDFTKLPQTQLEKDSDVMAPSSTGPFWIAPLGQEGWQEIVVAGAFLKGHGRPFIPAQVRFGLPALWDGAGVVEAPHLDYRRVNHKRDAGLPLVSIEKILFRPRHSLSGTGFCLA